MEIFKIHQSFSLFLFPRKFRVLALGGFCSFEDDMLYMKVFFRSKTWWRIDLLKFLEMNQILYPILSLEDTFFYKIQTPSNSVSHSPRKSKGMIGDFSMLQHSLDSFKYWTWLECWHVPYLLWVHCILEAIDAAVFVLNFQILCFLDVSKLFGFAWSSRGHSANLIDFPSVINVELKT